MTDGVPSTELTEVEGEEKSIETPIKSGQPVVQPKQWEERPEEVLEDNSTQGPGGTQAPSGHWWHSSALLGKIGLRAPTPPPLGPQFQGWIERQWAEDEEGEWSYSTGPGATTMDVLRERFSEASFRDAPSWQPWAPGLEPSTTWQDGAAARGGSESRLRLASPKFRPEQRQGQSRVDDGYHVLEASASSLGGSGQPQPQSLRDGGQVKGTDGRWARSERTMMDAQGNLHPCGL